MASYTLKEILEVSCSDYAGTYEKMKEITGSYPAIAFGLRMPLDVAEAFDSAGVDVDALEKALAKKMFSEKKNCSGCKECTCNEKETESDTADPQVTEDKPKSKRGRKPKATAEKVEKTEPEDTAAETEYDGKTAKELFNLCKFRGIICEMKKPASYYKDLLIKADAETNTNAEDEDDWGEEPEEKPRNKRGRKSKAKVEEPEQEPEEEEDEEDDDWDI